MRREQFTLEITDIDWVDQETDPELPTLSVSIDGDASAVLDSFRNRDDDSVADVTDVTVRLYGSPDEPDAEGVVAVTDRVTGEYIIEANVDTANILTFVTAARRYGEHTDTATRYRVRVEPDGSHSPVVIEKRTLLVYSGDGELLRSHSLIPSGVEI